MQSVNEVSLSFSVHVYCVCTLLQATYINNSMTSLSTYSVDSMHLVFMKYHNGHVHTYVQYIKRK